MQATLDCWAKNDCCVPTLKSPPMDLAEFELYKKFLELKGSKEKSDDPTNEDITWCDFWKKVNVFIGKDVLPPTVMKFASYLKGMKEMSQWKESDIQNEYKTWSVNPEKEEPKADAEKPKAEKAEKAEKVKEPKKPKAEKAEEPKAKKAEKPKVEKAEKPKVEKEKPKEEKAEKEKPKEEKSKEADESETKKNIPKNVKTDVWNTFIGEGIANHKCLCCKMTTIDKAKFDCGHVVSKADGGGQEIYNLRPICSGCNNGMGTMNMIDYVKKHGYYIGGGR